MAGTSPLRLLLCSRNRVRLSRLLRSGIVPVSMLSRRFRSSRLAGNMLPAGTEPVSSLLCTHRNHILGMPVKLGILPFQRVGLDDEP